jgi:predicted ATP-binding protein involved in virulence
MTNKVITETAPDNNKENKPTIPAYFLSITVKNVRCFGPQQTLNLSNSQNRPAQWTIILGDNGFGKTTLLRSIVALTPKSVISKVYKEHHEFILPKAFPDSATKGDFFKLHRYGAERSSLSARFFSGIRLEERKAQGNVSDFSVDIYPDGGAGASHLSPPHFKDLLCFAYGASRRMGETSLSERTDDDAFASLFSDDVELMNAEEWLLQADYAAHAANKASVRKQAGNRRDEIKDVLVHLLPEVTDIRFAQLTEKQQKPGVEVETPYGWVSLRELSLGYKTLIAWMVDFASRMFDRYPDSPNPLAEPAVVLVDEIDLHLHPKWQRTLMGYLSERFPNTQFIATAHSPLVVQAAQDANIVLLRREGDHVVIENNVEAVRNWRVDQILTSDLFGLESARPPETDKLMAERTKILSKSRLTKKDRERLKKLEEEIGSLPTGETPEEIEAMDVIRRAAERLKAEGY